MVDHHREEHWSGGRVGGARWTARIRAVGGEGRRIGFSGAVGGRAKEGRAGELPAEE